MAEYNDSDDWPDLMALQSIAKKLIAKQELRNIKL